MKSYADALATAGCPISDADLIDFIVYGLGTDYKDFITTLCFFPAISFDDFYDLLLQEESLVKHMPSV